MDPREPDSPVDSARSSPRRRSRSGTASSAYSDSFCYSPSETPRADPPYAAPAPSSPDVLDFPDLPSPSAPTFDGPSAPPDISDLPPPTFDNSPPPPDVPDLPDLPSPARPTFDHSAPDGSACDGSLLDDDPLFISAPRIFGLSSQVVVYSHPGADTLSSTLADLSSACAARLDRLLAVALPCAADPSDRAGAIVEFVERSRRARQLRALGARLRALADEKARLLAGIGGVRESPEALALLREIAAAEGRIRWLSESVARGERELAERVREGEDSRVGIARLKAEVEALEGEVASVRMRADALERRIALMKQRTSQYATLFTRNPDPRLRISGGIEDILRRFAEQEAE